MDQSTISSACEIPEDWPRKFDTQLRRIATRRLRDSNLADDVVQETYIAALKSIDKYRGEGKFLSWLMTILARKIVDSARKKQRFREVPLQIQTDSERSVEHYDSKAFCAQAGQQPDEIAQCNEMERRIDKFVDSSAPQVAELYRLRFRKHLSTEEICQRMNLSPGNVWLRTHRLRRALALVALPCNAGI